MSTNYNILPASNITDKLSQRLSTVRTARVNSSVLDHINVEAYDSHMKIVEVATVTIPEPGQLMITPFDKSLLSKIEKGINNSNLGVTPNNDGAGIRLVFPPLTEETRKLKVKELSKYEEDAKIEVRTNRQKLVQEQKQLKESKEITEDDLKDFETALQKEVDELNKEIESLIATKEAEIMKV